MARILVIDDSIFTRMKVGRLFQTLGHEILEASNGLEGLRIALADRPDCIFTDLLMPQLDGIGFLKALRKAAPTLPVVILTADIQEAKHRQCLSLGVVDLITKPVKDEVLKRVLHRALNTVKKGNDSW